jgi:cobalt-precorrin 5A hydrolase
VKIAVISLSNEGARLAARLARGCTVSGGTVSGSAECDVFLHTGVTELPEVKRFEHVCELTREVFPRYDGLVYVAPVGLVVRAVAPCLEHKSVDPGVVVVDVGGRWVVSLVGGHEGGANALAFAVANLLGAEPVVSTTTEALKDLIVGVGCRRGAAAADIVAAVRQALVTAACDLARVRVLASADLKADEPGLIEAARMLGLPLRLVTAEEIRGTVCAFEVSSFVQDKVDLPAVAEPAALLAGRRTRLVLPKMVIHAVTVAIARESCMSLG